MASWDLFNAPNAPAAPSMAPPLVNLGPVIGDLANDYFKGAEQKRQYDAARVFQGGLPRDPSGQLDTNKILETGARVGGLPYVQALMPFLLQQQSGAENAGAIRDVEGYVSGAQPPPSAAPAAPPRSPTGYSGGDNGKNTIASFVAGAVPAELAGPLINQYSARMQVDPNQPLNGTQISLLKAMHARQAGGDQSGAPTPIMGTPAAAPPQPTIQGGADFRSTPVQTVQIRPFGAAAQPQAGRPPVPPPATPATRPAQPPAQGSAPGMDEATAQRLDLAAAALRANASRLGKFDPEGSKALLAQAENYSQRSAKIREAITANQALTPEQKLARQEGVSPLQFEQKKEQQKDDVTRYGKQLSSIQGSAQAANRMLQHIQFAEGIYKNPNFYSGSFEGLNLMYKKVVNALDPHNTDALPQEAFRKTMAAAVLNQVEQLKDDTAAVGGGGRIFQAQIELMEKAANNPDNSVPANRLLTEIAKRAALESKRIAAMANKYKGGHLDAEFAQKVDDYYTEHPMFTPAEMNNINIIAPPTFSNAKEAAAAKLPPGTPIKIDGKWYKSP